MRLLLLILLLTLTSPAFAWEYTPGPPCLLTHETAEARFELKYDPTQPLYAITITKAVPWAQAPGFAMQFDGPAARAVGTDRHMLSEDGLSLTVTDRGFDNLLDGLRDNVTVTAIAGPHNVSASLEGADAAIKAFRTCPLPLS